MKAFQGWNGTMGGIVPHEARGRRGGEAERQHRGPRDCCRSASSAPIAWFFSRRTFLTQDKEVGKQKERIEELDVGDPFEFFTDKARRVRQDLSIPIDFLHEAVAIVRGAYGDDWIRAQVEARKHASPLPEYVHPLGSYFGIAGESQIVSIFELAVYLKRLATVRNLPQVIESMKEKWGPGLLQLAYAYRFLQSGATDLELEPDAEDGRKADIFFRVDGFPYLVECYIPRIQYRDTSVELLHSFDRIREVVAGKPTRISIRLRRSIDAKDRKRMEGEIIKAIREGGTRKVIEIEDDALTVRIERVTSEEIEHDIPRPESGGQAYGNADWGEKSNLVPRSRVGEIRYRDVPEQAASSILVWQAAEEKRPIPLHERIEELNKKIRKKLAQTRRADNPRRMVVVEIPEASRADQETVRLAQDLQATILAKHDRFAALLLTYRLWTRQKRYKYALYFLEGRPEYCLPSGIFDGLKAHEANPGKDVLQDWE